MNHDPGMVAALAQPDAPPSISARPSASASQERKSSESDVFQNRCFSPSFEHIGSIAYDILLVASSSRSSIGLLPLAKVAKGHSWQFGPGNTKSIFLKTHPYQNELA